MDVRFFFHFRVQMRFEEYLRTELGCESVKGAGGAGGGCIRYAYLRNSLGVFSMSSFSNYFLFQSSPGNVSYKFILEVDFLAKIF